MVSLHNNRILTKTVTKRVSKLNGLPKTSILKIIFINSFILMVLEIQHRIFKKKFFLDLFISCVLCLHNVWSACLCIYVNHMYAWFLQRSEEGIRFLATGLMGG